VPRPVPRVTGRDLLMLNTERYRISVDPTQTVPNCSATEEAGPSRPSGPAPLDRPLNVRGGAASSLPRITFWMQTTGAVLLTVVTAPRGARGGATPDKARPPVLSHLKLYTVSIALVLLDALSAAG
jgi:hypothetical protein